VPIPLQSILNTKTNRRRQSLHAFAPLSLLWLACEQAERLGKRPPATAYAAHAGQTGEDLIEAVQQLGIDNGGDDAEDMGHDDYGEEEHYGEEAEGEAHNGGLLNGAAQAAAAAANSIAGAAHGVADAVNDGGGGGYPAQAASAEAAGG